MSGNFLYSLKSFLEKLDSYRDKALFIFIKPYWSKRITPNHVSYVRVFIGILIFILLFFFNIETKFLILTLFIIGALTDFIDGPIARGNNQVTDFGGMLDPVADRFLVVPIVFYSLLKNQVWLLAALVIVEVLHVIINVSYRSKNTYLKANIFGKIKMFLLCVALIAILVYWPNTPPFSIWIIWASIPFTLLSAITKTLDSKKNT